MQTIQNPKIMSKFQYKAVIYQESALSSMLLGSAKVDPLRFTDFLNEHGKQGWRVRTMQSEQRRTFFFWRREAMVVILERMLVPKPRPEGS